MKVLLLIFILLFFQPCFSQTIPDSLSANCITPIEKNMPFYEGGCNELEKYFNEFFNYDTIIQFQHLPKITSFASCTLDSTGFLKEIKISSTDSIYDNKIRESLINMKRWKVSKLKKEEYYSMLFLFRFEYEFNLSVTINWEIKKTQ